VQYPKFIVDLSIFLLIALYFLFKNNTPLSINAGEIAIFIVAGTRILPAIQIIYNALTAVSGNLDLISSFNNPDNSLEKKIKCATQKNISNAEFQDSYILKIIKNNNLDPKFSELNIGEITFCSGKNYIIHGKSGIGKSSLFLYLANLIDSDSINITLDGADNCREAIANNILLSIDSDLFFSGSVLDNINDFTCKDLNGISIKEALEIAGCKFLSVASNISDNAKNLSTGQRQRLSLARVLAVDKRPILLIDESLSGLPPNEERIIYHNLFNLFKSVIVISHRTDNDDIFDFTYTL
jgi:ABC-type bacteriocin/lantibiotic exporter with double-glycine peptidase domain